MRFTMVGCKRSLPSFPPPPRFIFCAPPILRAAKTRALFSFRLKRTGTLATQANQSDVKSQRAILGRLRSHEGLTCVRVCGFCKLLSSTTSIDRVFLNRCVFPRRCTVFRQARVFISPWLFLTRSIVSSASFSIDQSMRVFDKVH